MQNHTPTPWKIEQPDGYFTVIGSDGSIAFDDGSACGEYGQECSEANAAFIVRAVNAHEEMLAALKHTRDWLNDKATTERDEYKHAGYAHHVLRLDAAIAKAEGK